MRVYHGTSFENACQILSKNTWEFPIEFSLKSEYEVNNLIGKKEYTHKDRVIQNGNHFTTSLEHAKSYANQFDKSVVLFFDYETSKCLDFIIKEPIPTKGIKCIEACFKGNKLNYGLICNSIYNKPVGNTNVFLKKLGILFNGCP